MANMEIEMTTEQKINSCEHSMVQLFKSAQKEYHINDMYLVQNEKGVKFDLYGININTNKFSKIIIYSELITKLIRDLQETTNIEINGFEMQDRYDGVYINLSYC